MMPGGRGAGCAPNLGIKAARMFDTALSALVKAWAATLIATSLLVAALAISEVWDAAAYLQALPAALGAPC